MPSGRHPTNEVWYRRGQPARTDVRPSLPTALNAARMDPAARLPAQITVIAAHPELSLSRVNRRLMALARDLPRVELRDLYALYPDYLIDVEAEQAALDAAGLVVWLHPIQWYSMPALMKLWLDDVFARGYAYGPGGRALAGKHLWVVASAGSPEESYSAAGYNERALEEFLLPYRQTARLARMRFLPPLLLHGSRRVSTTQIERHAQQWVERLETWPRWVEAETAVGAGAEPEVAATDRPR